MARYEGLSGYDIGTVLQVKLGPRYTVQNPTVERLDTPKGSKTVFKALIATGKASRRHYAYFVSRISDKDMDDWLDHAIAKIKVYMHDPTPHLLH
jgi:hypothetical protein